MKKLTSEQEIRLLKKALIRGEFISHGSSRAVYGLNDRFVLKVSDNSAGNNQNKREVSVYKYSRDIKANLLLAEIVGYSDDMVIMERVRTIDMLDAADIHSEFEWHEKESDLTDEEKEFLSVFHIDFHDAKKLGETVEFLAEINGSTYDNYQVGISLKNGIVAYDYGYVNDDSRHQVGTLDKTFDNSKSGKFVENILKRKLNIL